jgi:hypothetical protein
VALVGSAKGFPVKDALRSPLESAEAQVTSPLIEAEIFIVLCLAFRTTVNLFYPA